MGISREEGYRRAAGKEEGGLRVVERFFEERVGVPLVRITDRDDNYALGDFRAPSGETIECKRQDIGRYRQNFVEVCERTSGGNPTHAAGSETLRGTLGISADELESVPVVNHGANERVERFDRPPALSVSITSLNSAALWVYVNPDVGGRYVYVYPSRELLELVRSAVLEDGMELGRGRSNEDTYAVFVPNPDWRWKGKEGEPWEFIGPGDEQDALAILRDLLSE